MKKLLPALVVLLLVLSGCGGQGSASSSTSSSPEAQQAKIGGRTGAKPARNNHVAHHTPPATHLKKKPAPASKPKASSKPARSASTPVSAGLASRGTVVTVTRVVDGDTIYVSPAVDGLTDVRLIGVDTPETHKPGTPVQPYGPQAAQFTTSHLAGRKVALETDVEKVDPYDRLLAYVWTSPNTMFNEVLLKEGYAQLATFPPNVKYVERFREDQAEARAAGRGLWGLPPSQLCQETDRGNGIGGGCSTTPASSSPVSSAPVSPAPAPSPPSSGAAPPTGKSDYDCSDFQTQAEAQRYLLPGDPYHLDADGDGIACDSLP
ncbi:thermonuclease family protein [Rubrobacter calidifluminis]|uniref:thermonuclease family protein n=1 Tax=Rubrobacter calidifluminis TaxID=1392640 RepID=UPI0023610BA7|nr:thermonuclease family protein [Rubrobacter calidifluminis]